MIKRIVIAGCRNYNNYDEAKKFIDSCLIDINKENEIIIVSGGASGADAIGVSVTQRKKDLRLKNMLLSGKNTAEPQALNVTRKWQK